MSKAELLEEFAKLTPAERSEVWDALWNLEERTLLDAEVATPKEKVILDRELDDYRTDPRSGSPWKDVEERLRQRE